MHHLYKFVCLLLVSCVSHAPFDRDVRVVPQLVEPFSGALSHAFDHSALKMHRNASDCQPECPQIHAWRYLYKPGDKILTDQKPIATRKEFWKNSEEARIISVSLFGTQEIYLKGLIQFLDSMSFVSEVNGASEKHWGYESFTVRVYSPKRAPENVLSLGLLSGEIPESYVENLLNRGVEIVYVDNLREKVGRDASFWRFLVASESMPEGQKIRYLIRDADWLLTAGEIFSLGEWIASRKQFHRMHLQPFCIGPMTAGMWGGSHTGQGLFSDLHAMMAYYPYRSVYGDDELFLCSEKLLKPYSFEDSPNASLILDHPRSIRFLGPSEELLENNLQTEHRSLVSFEVPLKAM